MDPITLNVEMMVVMGLLTITIILFAFELLRVDVAAICIMVLLGLSTLVPGLKPLVSNEELFSGFSSNAVISVIAVMIIGAGLDKTGLMSKLAALILKKGGKTEGRIIPLVYPHRHPHVTTADADGLLRHPRWYCHHDRLQPTHFIE